MGSQQDQDDQATLRWIGLVAIAIGYTVLYLKDRQLRRGIEP